ncbi:unnamed protein product [marine sediment metagenome]|uniref:Uncharacterized protein n=1 Tax=marine sediment metagenome TaxID=412755 RepID=X0W1N3_9ZZZZ
MPNPNQVTCVVDGWTKVATNVTVTGGSLWRMSSDPTGYLFTYKLTGEAAPTLITVGVPIFRDAEPDYEVINAAGIDLYVWAIGAAGSVMVHV